MSIDLNIVKLSETGYHFCLQCQRVTELHGDEYHQHCIHCGSVRVRWNPPVMAS